MSVVIEHWLSPSNETYASLFYERLGGVLQNKIGVQQFLQAYEAWGRSNNNDGHGAAFVLPPLGTNIWTPCSMCYGHNTMTVVYDTRFQMCYLHCHSCGATKYNIMW